MSHRNMNLGLFALDWQQQITELIDMRSFSNLWFWIALAVLWSSAAHWVLGVPYDMVIRAKRRGGQPAVDLEDLVRINVNRLLFVTGVSGYWMVAFTAFVLTSLALLGFFYWVEFAQALFLLAMPMSLVLLLTIHTATRIRATGDSGEALYRRLALHRLLIQVIGLIAIFITALWGMYQNFLNAVLIG